MERRRMIVCHFDEGSTHIPAEFCQKERNKLVYAAIDSEQENEFCFLFRKNFPDDEFVLQYEAAIKAAEQDEDSCEFYMEGAEILADELAEIAFDAAVWPEKLKEHGCVQVDVKAQFYKNRMNLDGFEIEWHSARLQPNGEIEKTLLTR